MHSNGPGRLNRGYNKYVIAVDKNQVSLQTRHKTQHCLANKAGKVVTYDAPSFGESTHEASISKTPHGLRTTAPALIIATAAGSVAASTTKNALDIRIESHWFITNQLIPLNSVSHGLQCFQ